MRRDGIGNHVAVKPRFWGAAGALPAYLLINELPHRLFLLVLFALMAIWAGKRIRWTYYLLLIAAVTFFHLLAPWGRVLLTLGPITVTAGALENGLMRSMGMIGMVFLSLAAIRPELTLPGRFGGLLSRTLYHFDSIIESKIRLSWRGFFEGLDNLLMEKFNPHQEQFPWMDQSRADTPDLSSSRGWPFALLFALIPWTTWFLTLLPKLLSRA